MTITSEPQTGAAMEEARRLAEKAVQRAEYIGGLRALADALEQHPNVGLPYQGTHDFTAITFHFLTVDDPRTEMAATRRALGVPMSKRPREDGYFDLAGTLHGLHVKLTAFRKDVCERVVVATREIEVEEPDPDAVAALPKVVRTEVVEDVEWVCHPILAGEQSEAADQAGVPA